METPAEIRERWRYLRDLLIDQLARFESGALQMHSSDANVSAAAITGLKRQILDFDEMIGYLAINTNPGDTVTLTVYRNGQILELPVTLTSR